MKNLLHKLFTRYGFHKPDNNSDIIFYEKENTTEPQEFFLVQDMDKQRFMSTDDVISETLETFNTYKARHGDVAKNTSYILTLKMNRLCDDIDELKNKILKIEEDTYWFKKYVIVYTDLSIANLNEAEDIDQYLKAQLHNKDLFNAFKNDTYNDESYFVTVQLFLKLPFLIVPVDNNSELVSIEQLVNNGLSGTQKNLLQTLKNLGDIEESTNWSQVLEIVTLQSSDETTIDEFLEKFSTNA